MAEGRRAAAAQKSQSAPARGQVQKIRRSGRLLQNVTSSGGTAKKKLTGPQASAGRLATLELDGNKPGLLDDISDGLLSSDRSDGSDDGGGEDYEEGAPSTTPGRRGAAAATSSRRATTNKRARKVARTPRPENWKRYRRRNFDELLAIAQAASQAGGSNGGITGGGVGALAATDGLDDHTRVALEEQRKQLSAFLACEVQASRGAGSAQERPRRQGRRLCGACLGPGLYACRACGGRFCSMACRRLHREVICPVTGTASR